MAVTVPLDLGYEFEVKSSFKEVFDLVADVPTSASFFPKLDQLLDLGGGTYRWEMEKLGTEQVHIQTVYASTYVADRKRGTVVWTPVKGQGNAQVGGSWTLTDKKKTTVLQLKIEGAAQVPLPSLMAMVVVPVVQGEFESLVEKYIDNLIKRFGGEA
jgi:carbon monoxide dehydrogenase subunit G